jgi:hypothetical protein
MLGTESRSLERHAHNPQRAIRAPDHGPLHRRWVANRTADATLIRPEMLRSVRQIDSLGLENPSSSVPIGRSISRAELPSTTQNWQHCTDVCSRLANLMCRSRVNPRSVRLLRMRSVGLRSRFRQSRRDAPAPLRCEFPRSISPFAQSARMNRPSIVSPPSRRPNGRL